MTIPRDLVLSRERVELQAKSDNYLRELLDALGEVGRVSEFPHLPTCWVWGLALTTTLHFVFRICLPATRLFFARTGPLLLPLNCRCSRSSFVARGLGGCEMVIWWCDRAF
jgi:hypothetical protein